MAPQVVEISREGGKEHGAQRHVDGAPREPLVAMRSVHRAAHAEAQGRARHEREGQGGADRAHRDGLPTRDCA